MLSTCNQTVPGHDGDGIAGPSHRSPRVLVVDDHEVFTEALRLALQVAGFDEVDRVAELTVDGVRQAVDETSPDVVLLDLRLGDGVPPLPLVHELVARDVAVLMVTGVDDPGALGDCVEAGAAGVFCKSGPLEELVDLVWRAASREPAIAPQVRHELLDAARRERARRRDRAARFQALTEREAAVLAAMVEGKPARVIAEEEYVSLATVRTHIRSVLAKLGVASQLAAVAEARRAGWPRHPTADSGLPNPQY